MFLVFVIFLSVVHHGATVYLSDLTAASVSNVHGGLVKDGVYYSPYKITLNGVIYAKGLGMHAPKTGVGRATYSLHKQYQNFSSIIGLTDKTQPCGNGVIFRVYVDNSKMFEQLVDQRNVQIHVNIGVWMKSTLTLEVDPNGSNHCDHSMWADAQLKLRNPTTSPSKQPTFNPSTSNPSSTPSRNRTRDPAFPSTYTPTTIRTSSSTTVLTQLATTLSGNFQQSLKSSSSTNMNTVLIGVLGGGGLGLICCMIFVAFFCFQYGKWTANEGDELVPDRSSMIPITPIASMTPSGFERKSTFDYEGTRTTECDVAVANDAVEGKDYGVEGDQTGENEGSHRYP